MMRIVLLAATAALIAGAAQASPASGLWKTPENNGQVEITDCGAGICGRVVTSDRIKADPELKDARNKNEALRSRTLKGLPLFEGLTGGPEVWKGKVYNPEDGGVYSGSVKLLDANTLKLTGCIVFPLCKSESWTRLR